MGNIYTSRKNGKQICAKITNTHRIPEKRKLECLISEKMGKLSSS
jgi:hypothetical protein